MVNLPHGREIQGSLRVRSLLLRSILLLVRLNGLSVRKSFWSAQKLIAGIETMHRVKKGQLRYPNGQPMSAADQFYYLAF